MHESAVTELDLDLGPVNVRLRRPAFGDALPAPAPAGVGVLPPAAEVETGHLITAPMIGTFYASPSPGAPPFVQRGDQVFAGQTIGIIEAMKIMNEISADRGGVVLEVLIENGQPVEYGSPLIRLGVGRDARS
ncbi:MAG: acetyl-CoA carboxylase biotin carboxyl carrier protein [Thermomicrobiales bacterium]|nr:acetyl-CoA carboxylase biotin carboxyl carrier protein [Thermomicrobiales bacterium]